MEISEAEFDRANQRMAKRRKTEPYALAAEYERARNMIAVTLSNGTEVRFPVDRLQGLAGAKADELAQIEIDPAGYGLSFPKLDADFSLPDLMQGVFGSRAWMAAMLGREGGKSASPKKVIAARANGRLGGRPKK
jgi:Protein of unknown function (DUF2442)